MIKKTQNDLEKIRENLKDLPGWKAEIKVIDEKMSAFKDISFSEIGYKIGGKSFTIEDLLVKDETKRNSLEAKVLHTEYNLKEIETFICILDENEQKVIRERYINNLNLSNSYDNLAKRLTFSKTSVFRIHNEAIEKIANERLKRLNYIDIA